MGVSLDTVWQAVLELEKRLRHFEIVRELCTGEYFAGLRRMR